MANIPNYIESRATARRTVAEADCRPRNELAEAMGQSFGARITPDGFDEVDERFVDDNIASDDYEHESRSDSDDEPLEVYEDNSSDDTDDSYEDNSDYGDEN